MFQVNDSKNQQVIYLNLIWEIYSWEKSHNRGHTNKLYKEKQSNSHTIYPILNINSLTY